MAEVSSDLRGSFIIKCRWQKVQQVEARLFTSETDPNVIFDCQSRDPFLQAVTYIRADFNFRLC